MSLSQRRLAVVGRRNWTNSHSELLSLYFPPRFLKEEDGEKERRKKLFANEPPPGLNKLGLNVIFVFGKTPLWPRSPSESVLRRRGNVQLGTGIGRRASMWLGWHPPLVYRQRRERKGQGRWGSVWPGKDKIWDSLLDKWKEIGSERDKKGDFSPLVLLGDWVHGLTWTLAAEEQLIVSHYQLKRLLPLRSYLEDEFLAVAPSLRDHH